MGYYINPSDESKESWLRSRGSLIQGNPETLSLEPDRVLVCLVDNGRMKAAGIGYCSEEVAVFNTPHDTRPKVWYSVARQDILAIHPEYESVL